MLGEVLFPEGNDGGDLHYEAGIDWRAEKKKKNVSVVPSFPAGIYRSIEPGNRLHLRLQGKGVFGEGKDRTYGTLMHRILSQIETLDRIDDTIAEFVRSGELSESESKSIREDINRWLADEPSEFVVFAGGERVDGKGNFTARWFVLSSRPGCRNGQ